MKPSFLKHSFRSLALASAITVTLSGINIAHADQTSNPTGKQTVSDEVGEARREAQIWTSYAFNRHLKAFDLSVKVEGDRALLTGKVENSVEKDLAEQIALGVEGIKRIDNQIQVQANYEPPKRTHERSFDDKVADATITASVKSKLLWNSNTDGLDIHVETTAGRITLTGKTETAAQRDLAAHIAMNTDGVVNVNNHIVVSNLPDDSSRAKANMKNTADTAEEAVSDAWITTKVKSTLLLSRNVHGLDINVNTNNGVVALVGKVASGTERDLAIALAKDIRGVKKVDASSLKVE